MRIGVTRFLIITTGALLFAPLLHGSENAIHRPFGQWADVPNQGEFVVGLAYQESEAYRIWANRDQHNITVKAGGESYGIDINQGYVVMQYGITERWSADLAVGATTMGWRTFDPDQKVHSTTGLMDWSIGVRYQISKESNENGADWNWVPTLSFRVGAVLPGSYNEHIAFAPGVRSAAIEPEFIVRKHFGWSGFGAYADALFRWNRTTGNDQYIVAVGLFQQIKRWELAVGYRHLQTITGGDISYDPADPSAIIYPRDVREINDSIEAGFSYTTLKHRIRYAFESRTDFDGSNTDRKFWVGGSIEIPFATWLSKEK